MILGQTPLTSTGSVGVSTHAGSTSTVARNSPAVSFFMGSSGADLDFGTGLQGIVGDDPSQIFLTERVAHPDFWADDCAAATQNLMLAAHALGLGSVWVGLHPRTDRMEILSRLIHLPEEVEPFALIPIGHPAERPSNPERYHAEWIRSERWFEAWEHGRE